MKKIYKAAVIGCGRIGSTFSNDKKQKEIFGISSHAEMYKSSKKINLYAAVDKDKRKLLEFKTKWNVSNLYTKTKKLFSYEYFDIVSICTHLNSHYRIIKSAIDHDIKVIFCEKPFVNNLSNAKKILKKIKQKKLFLMVNYWRRWNPLFIDLKKKLESNYLGKLHHISCYYSGGINNTASHMVDLLYYLFGEVIEVRANKMNKNFDPDVTVFLKFKKGFDAVLNPIPKSSYYMFELDIYGSKGRIRIENNGLRVSYWKLNKNKKLILKKKKNTRTPLNQFKGQLKSILNFLRKKNLQKNIEEIYKSLEILIGINLSFKKDKIVEFPVKDLNFSIKSK